MTGIRQSIVFRIEKSFAEDPYTKEAAQGGTIGSDEQMWIEVPPGSYFQNTHTRSTAKIYGMGAKFYEMPEYGALSGSWEWTFPLSYEYLEPLLLAFEDYSAPSEGSDYHVFRKANAKRVCSFAVRRKILNRIAGGPDKSDEVDYIMGCVVKSFRISRSAGSSKATVTMSGMYSKDRMVKGNLESTDYTTRSANLVEYGCLIYDDMPGNDVISKPAVVDCVDSITLSVDNGVSPISSTCTPFAVGYYEGKSSCTFGITAYANDPGRIKQRTYSGGYLSKDKLPTAPMTRTMKPLPVATVFSFNLNRDTFSNSDEVGFTSTGASMDPIDRFRNSDYSAMFIIKDTIVKSISWQKGDGGRLMDQISSAECKDISLMFKNGIESSYTTSPHQIKG